MKKIIPFLTMVVFIISHSVRAHAQAPPRTHYEQQVGDVIYSIDLGSDSLIYTETVAFSPYDTATIVRTSCVHQGAAVFFVIDGQNCKGTVVNNRFCLNAGPGSWPPDPYTKRQLSNGNGKAAIGSQLMPSKLGYHIKRQ